MMIRRTRSGTITFTEFCDLISEDQKADLLDGVIYLASPENSDHNLLGGWLYKLIGVFAEERKLGLVFFNKVAFRLSDSTAPEPEIGFVSASREHLIQPGYVDGPPDLAIEIVSPDSVDRDYENKRMRYEEAGVREYWIIDPAEKTATFFTLEAGAFVEQFPSNQVFQSQVLPGFALDVRWLFDRPLPSTMTTINRLLDRT